MKISDKYIMVAGLCLLAYYIHNSGTKNIVPDQNPNVPVVVVPDNKPVPALKENIFYDEYDKVKQLAITHNKKVVIIFGADWCPYCRDIKKDTKNNEINNFKNYLVCFIDTDKNSDLTKQFRIKGLPTSIIIDSKETELSRKVGYKNDDYNNWLNDNLQENFVSWIEHAL